MFNINIRFKLKYKRVTDARQARRLDDDVALYREIEKVGAPNSH